MAKLRVHDFTMSLDGYAAGPDQSRDDPLGVFVLTHHARPSIPMEGGTTFHFVTDGIEAALARAVEAAGGADVRLAGGSATIQEYLRAGLVDEMHVVIAPILLGSGERLFDNLNDGWRGYEVAEMVSSSAATHARLVRSE